MDENLRFIKLIDELKANGEIADYVQAAKVLQTNKAGISDIKNGRKKLSIELLRRMKSSYPSVNIEWVIMGTGLPFIEETTDTCPAKTPESDIEGGEQYSGIVSQFLSSMNSKDDTIREQAEEIGRLRERILQLEKELRGAASDAQSGGAANVG